MDSNAVSEEDKAGLLRLEAHDASTLEQVEARMQYEVTSTAASDLYARTGNDTSKIRAYVGKVFHPLYHVLHIAKQEADTS